ncbi:MAG TPA: hypothetical protein VMN82_14470 [Thermoanaerobaculia bacterium]|nr:hypothetical protein [Thermoanaerobaculia bacterium]
MSLAGRIGLPVAMLALSVSLPSTAQEAPPRYFQESDSKLHLEFQWDALAWYDNVEHWKYYPPIDRGRFEFRPQVDLVVSPTLRFGVRGSFNYGTLPNEYNGYYEDNWLSRAAYVDRYFVQWTPGAWTVQGGSFALPVAASPMLWDKYNIQTPGASASYATSLSPESSLTFTGAGIYSAQHGPDESILGVGQVLWKAGDENRFGVQASLAYWNMDMRHVAPEYYRENEMTLVDGQPAYRSKFELLDSLVRLQFPVARLPVTVSLDFVHNFGRVGNAGANAWETGLLVGTVGTPRTFRAFVFYQYIGREALVGAYNTDEWWWHTWAKGYRFGVAYTILPLVYLEPAMVVQKRLDLDYWLTRVTVSLVKMF